MERYRELGTTILYFNTYFMNELVMDETELEISRLKEFTLMLEMFIGNLDIKANLSDVGLVFFLIVDVDKYYLLCFDLKRGRYLIIDHVKHIGTVESRYGKIPRTLQRFFCNYLMTQNHRMHVELYSKEAKIMRVVWEVRDIGPDCGLYLMRHMECYKGDLEGKWETGFKGIKDSDVAVLSRLRYKYMYRLMTSDHNLQKDMLLEEADKFSKLDILQKSMLFDEAMELAKNKRKKYKKSKEREKVAETGIVV
ncbi:unnamed protein product [Lactuca saligna]|uniref:Ubiquitin-like protease family profile domain-containing protein n=1 Tax=Lactuca saligna TaxID=75948 RepID=A0AA35YXJ0_LACSI|nr:unnamed protein product [Lactuca saligna]